MNNTIKWKKRYDITCPHCSESLDCAPSIFHMMGAYELGGGNCIKCKGFMEIHFNPDTNTMTAYKANTDSSDVTAVSGRIDEDGHSEILIDGDAFIQVCTTCGRPIEFHESDELDEYGNCVNCQGGHHA